MDFSNVVSHEEWLEARKALLAKEKEATRANDALRAERQALPLVRLEKDYILDSPDGPVSLRELFGESSQLLFQHFMFDPEWEDGCPSCSHAVDTLGPGHVTHLQNADTAFVIVSRAPLAKLARWHAKGAGRCPGFSLTATTSTGTFTRRSIPRWRRSWSTSATNRGRVARLQRFLAGG